MVESDPSGLTHWDDVRVFLAVIRAGTFTGAARLLETEQSTVSRRMASLEAELGGALFERARGKPQLTELGLRLREYAERIEADVHLFSDVALGEHRAIRGRVRIATTEGLAIHVLVPWVLPALRRTHPDLELELLTSDHAVDLAAREADIALRFFRTTRGDLVGRKVAELSMAVLGTRALAKRLDPARLPWIAVEPRGVDTPEAAWFAAHSQLPPVLRCSSYEVQLAAVRAGLGVGMAPRSFLRIDPELVAISGLPPGPKLELHLVTRRAIRELPRIATVLAALDEHLSKLT